jgi:hypothetical protein
MRLKRLTMPAASLLLLCAACNSSSPKEAKADIVRSFKTADVQMGSVAADSTKVAPDGPVATDKEDEQPQAAYRVGAPKQSKTPTAEPASNPDWDKKIIKTADLGIEVRSFRHFTHVIKLSRNWVI